MVLGRVLRVGVLALGGLWAGGCGGSSAKPPPPNCLAVQPCGGDVVGTWAFVGTCADLAAQNEQLQMGCAGQMVNSDSVNLAGLLTFNSDLSYTATNWHENFGGTETVPLSCTGAATCAANSSTTNLNSSSATGTITTTCSGGSTCACTVAGSLNLTTETGTYATTTTVLEMTADVTGSTFNYCVQGDELHLMQTVTETLATPQGSTTTTIILSDIVAQRH